MMSATQRIPAAAAACAALVAGMLAGCSSGTGAPAAADRRTVPAPLEYVALGDSYASGYGAGSYSEECGRSPSGLPGLLDADENVSLAADATCAGAVAAPRSDGASTLPDQVAGLVTEGTLGPGTDLITISAGGNDAGFGEVSETCAAAPLESCRRMVENKTTAVLPVLAGDLDRLYGRIRSAAPNATVVVTGYPHLFSPEFGVEAALSVPAQELFNGGTDSLNAVLEDAAEAHGFIWVPLTEAFRGHGLGAADAWITAADQPDGLHPTAAGYRSGYLAAVRGAVDLPALREAQR